MHGSFTSLENPSNATILPSELVTPSETTNRLITLCLKVVERRTDPRALGIVLDGYSRELSAARQNFQKQIAASDLPQSVQKSAQDVLSSFDNYLDALTYVRSWFGAPRRFPLEAAPQKLFEAYEELHNSLLAYEWNYLCQGDMPHPALNLIAKVIKATKEGTLSDERLNEIFDRLWAHFSAGLETFERDPDPLRRQRGVNAIHQVLAGIQAMDAYFQDYDLNVLDNGFIKFSEGCMLLVELMQESTGEALADKPTPSPQVNWVIHAARAVLEGLDPHLLERAQAWFEPQLAESYFRFEQCANQALSSSPRIAEQVPIARDGFDRLNRALPLLRLGLTRRPLLHKAIQYLQEGAELICQAWKIFTSFEEDASTTGCLHCGQRNPSYSKVCSRCGARLVIPIEYQEESHALQVVAAPEEEYAEAESNQADHLSRLIEACDAARFGRLSHLEFASITSWGKQLARNAAAGLSNLPTSSDNPIVARALSCLRQGIEEFKQGTDEMQWWVDTRANHHLDLASRILLQAYSNFVEVQDMASEAETM